MFIDERLYKNVINVDLSSFDQKNLVFIDERPSMMPSVSAAPSAAPSRELSVSVAPRSTLSKELSLSVASI